MANGFPVRKPAAEKAVFSENGGLVQIMSWLGESTERKFIFGFPTTVYPCDWRYRAMLPLPHAASQIVAPFGRYGTMSAVA